MDAANLLIGGLVGAIVGVAVTELIRWLRKPRAEFIGLGNDFPLPQQHFAAIPGIGHGTGTARFHKIRFRVQPTGLAAVRLDGPDAVTFAKWDELPEPVVSGRFEAYLVPSTFFLQLSDGEEYHLPVLIGYDDASGARQFDVFAGWWYGKGLIHQPPSFAVSESDEVKVTLLGLAWQKPWQPWTRRRTRSFTVAELTT